MEQPEFIDNVVVQETETTPEHEGDRFLRRLNAMADLAEHLTPKVHNDLADFFGKFMNDSLDRMADDENCPDLLKSVFRAI